MGGGVRTWVSTLSGAACLNPQFFRSSIDGKCGRKGRLVRSKHAFHYDALPAYSGARSNILVAFGFN
jgi:hypothetical protein